VLFVVVLLFWLLPLLLHGVGVVVVVVVDVWFEVCMCVCVCITGDAVVLCVYM